MRYGLATVSRINKIVGLFRRILFLLKGSFAKETYNFIDPTSHPIYIDMHIFTYMYTYICMYTHM